MGSTTMLGPYQLTLLGRLVKTLIRKRAISLPGRNMITRRQTGILVFVAALAYSPSHAFHFRTTDSENIHSNDTIAMFMSPDITDNLRGPPGSEHQITFKFINRDFGGVDFTFE